ncbi:MAG: hypothetical protein WA139_05885 [Candidatus Aenigmatarchaeota archaeon]
MKNHCHSCERYDNLKKCKYCNEYFCEEHLPAKMCLTPSVLNDKKTPAWIRTELEKEWRKEGGHPDAEYTTKRWKVFDRKEKIHDDSLIKLLDGTKIIHQPSLPPQKEPSEELKYETPFAPHPLKKSFRFPSNKIIILMIIFAVVAYFIFFVPQETKSNVLLSLEKTKNSFIDGIKNVVSTSNLLVNIEDVLNSPESFMGKNITINGKYGFFTNEAIVDNQGYKINVACGQDGRIFKYGSEYKAKGTLMSFDTCECQTRFVYNITEDEWKEFLSIFPKAVKPNKSFGYLFLPSPDEGWNENTLGFSPGRMEVSQCLNPHVVTKYVGYPTIIINETNKIEPKMDINNERRCDKNSIKKEYYFKCLEPLTLIS